mmetsp:Transcript_29727/g.39037  ORF Transcript_29727/g.39037 Transcript_29727/m.39037 type:complete len:83 (+) Transcript_29727:149-397(+)
MLFVLQYNCLFAISFSPHMKPRRPKFQVAKSNKDKQTKTYTCWCMAQAHLRMFLDYCSAYFEMNVEMFLSWVKFSLPKYVLH